MGDNGPSHEATPFEQALTQFKSKLTMKEQEVFRKTTLVDLRQCISELQDKQHSSRRLRDLNRLRPFLEAMEQFGQVVVKLTNNNNDIAAFIWGPIKMLLLISSTYTEAFNELLDIYKHIGQAMPLLLQYENLFQGKPYMLEVLSLMYKDLLNFHRTLIGYFRKPLWKQLFGPTWKVYKTRFIETLPNIARYRQLLENQAMTALFQDLQQSRGARSKNPLYHPLSLRTSDIRLITIHPSNDDTSLLSCSLENVPIFSAPPFVALSYCWGNLDDKVDITLNDFTVPVTTNLHSALRRLRADRLKHIWVDALCINQEDLEERSLQVRRMGLVFRKANHVAIWLGDAQSMVEDDFKSLFAEDSATAYQVQSSSAQRAFTWLLLKPYWTRVWIIQELAEASAITIFCGHHKISWEALERVSRAIFKAGICETDSDGLRSKFQDLLRLRIDRRGKKPVGLLEALYRSRYALSTDPKDKIYGLLGLAYDGFVFIPEPNYNQTVEDTYIEFSKALIEEGSPLDLIYLRTSRREISNSLPSWVVDWRDLNDTLAKEEFERIQVSIERTSSSPISSQIDQPSFSGNTLAVRGAILGTIDGMGSAFSVEGNESTAHVVTPEMRAYSVPSDFDCSTYIFIALLEAQMISATTAEHPSNPLGLWSSSDKTELGKLFSDPMEPNELEALSEWIDANRLFVAFGETMEFWNDIWASRPTDTERGATQGMYLRSFVTTILSGMRIATLQTGELGWVHPQCQKGDKLGKILGCNRYVVLRSVAGGFRVIGEARLHWFGGEPELLNRLETLIIS